MNTLFSMFDTSLPVHGVAEKAAFLEEIFAFAKVYEKAFGKTFRMVKPGDLRLVQDKSSATGHSLYCIAQADVARPDGAIEHDDEVLEPVHQLAVSMFQEEYEQWTFEMMCEIAMKCRVNDPRSVFLLNDQRFLGVILEELDGLVNVQHAITDEEAACIRKGIVPTILCTSAAWDTVANRCQVQRWLGH